MREVFCLIMLLISLLGNSQQRSFVNIGLDEGLAQSQVNMIHQDVNGYLWVATIGGLSRYDGQEIKNFYKSDGLLDNDVSVISESKSGRLYLGCLGGFSIYEGKRFQSFSLPEELIQYNVTAIDEDSEGLLWIGTNGGGLLTFDLKRMEFTSHTTENGGYIRWMDAGRSLVASNDGLYQNGTLLNEILKDQRVTDVEHVNGQQWVSTVSNGIFIFDGAWTHLSPEEVPLLSSIRKMCVTAEGSVWLATRNGAVVFSDGQWMKYGTQNGLPYENIRYICEDREQNIWLASNGQGIFRYAGDLFTTYTAGAPLISNAMLSMTEGVGGEKYLGMFDEGLQMMHGGGVVEMVSNVPETDVWALCKDSQGTIWVGTSVGLFRSAEDGFHEAFADRLPNSRITALYEDDKKDLWVGHRNGVSKIRSGQLESNPIASAVIQPKRVRSITQRGDHIYFGAENGLFQLDSKGNLKHFTEEDGLSDNSLYSNCTLDHTLWVGTKSGLLKADSMMNFQVVGLTEENEPQSINFLFASRNDRLYVGTNKGLYVSEELEQERVTFKNFTRTDGLPSLETNLNAIYQADNGDIYFGTSSGVVRFSEDFMLSLGEDRTPFLHIRDVLLWANEMDPEHIEYDYLDAEGLPQGLVLKPKDNHLTFQFVGIKLSDPKSVKYQYKLEGADSEWSPLSGTRSVTYSSLSPGEYTFMVRTVGGDSQAIVDPQTFQFRILAPLFLRPGPLLVECGVLLLLLYMLFRWQRNEAAKKTERVALGYENRMYALEQQSLNSSMNRHFIFNSLNAIQFYINKEEKREANKYLTSFAKLIRKNLDSTTEVWVSLKDELERTMLYLDLEEMRFSGRFSYKIHISDDVDVETVKLPSMTLQPYLENSIWHGILPKDDKGQLDIRIHLSENRLCIAIEDDGIGLVMSRKSKGSFNNHHESRGLTITYDRMKLFNKMTGKPYEVIGPEDRIIDGRVLGTRTLIYIPIEAPTVINGL